MESKEIKVTTGPDGKPSSVEVMPDRNPQTLTGTPPSQPQTVEDDVPGQRIGQHVLGQDRVVNHDEQGTDLQANPVAPKGQPAKTPVQPQTAVDTSPEHASDLIAKAHAASEEAAELIAKEEAKTKRKK